MAWLIINLKSYAESKTLAICEHAAALSGDVKIVVAPNAFYLSESAKLCSTFAQHVDPLEANRNTGFLPVEMARLAGATGSIVNHSEHRLTGRQLERVIAELRKREMTSVLCARDHREARRYAKLRPDVIAVEPPGLIGGDVSVSSAKPELIKKSVQAVHAVDPNIEVLVGAGVRTAQDVKIARELGAAGVLLASEVAKAKDPKAAMKKLLKGF